MRTVSNSSITKARKPPAYTKTGDSGETGLIGGRRVRKSSIRVRAYGDIDELNSILGIAIEFARTDRAKRILSEIQRDLFVLGSEIASPNQPALPSTGILPTVNEVMLTFVEKETENLHSELPALRNFILPGGTPAAAFLHLARAVARRAEREHVALAETEAVRPVVLQYLNRLSSLLFELARFENQKAGRREEVWSGKTTKRVA